MDTRWRITNGEAYIMEGSKEIAKVLYPIETEEDFKRFDNIAQTLRSSQEMKEVLESILNHIESNLISLDSSGYLLDDIKKVLSV